MRSTRQVRKSWLVWLKKMAKDREINTYGMKQEDIIEALVQLDALKERQFDSFSV